ncbi:Extradiol ring-cleavage dioxygenase class III enzyme subunit B [Penicillium atrosanguineum]|uniref:Extradiol ring-cleavage dioxygenase class III enzyme subunit B n=1 Tax=Penicillium atrosanguineum TaxID=1132637 RepID=A0A9W9H2L8_9EURO|nr:uncharacterized protein N7443_008730 [Penicillium atrosanguineum]KAJ5125683.1 Extradiol ring-cleavage dioxygenase class III enzyme subunit B [Penicillium atrosanguineum]KAJ5136447.1 Extradiol ring-cleavage dioxygenase class III enzyme subunit B [Penicillium atrosanguineum]KAJ5292777.1 hypothetical protein N7443_008730 [Penicillium atrosanguineum]KAJ5303183.1 Extradiol ring-cleavage dioxygenase class III enzyme subunit B [Penicillium atrosanguineum]
MDITFEERLPTYFIGHGGVSIMFKPQHELVRQGLRELGKEIKALNPTAIVCTCGEFQSDNDFIQGWPQALCNIPRQMLTNILLLVNLKEPTKVWHDIGPSWRTTFPHVFDYDYCHQSSRALGEQVLQHLQAKGIKAVGVERDLDHGIWVPFKLMFPDGEDELDVPILQISTYAGDDLEAHIQLGEALSSLDGRILFIGSGMLCHNLRATRLGTSDTAVAKSFEAAAGKALRAPTLQQRNVEFLTLQKRDDWIDAHPTAEHVLPLYMTLGVGLSLNRKEWKVWNQDQCIIGQSYYTFRLG